MAKERIEAFQKMSFHLLPKWHFLYIKHMNIPNIITFIRILLVPVAIIFNFVDIPNNFLIAGIIFLIAALSDNLDGYLARKYNKVTKLGIFFDPLADKLLTNTMLITLLSFGIFPLWIVLLLFARDIIVDGFTSFAVNSKKFIPAQWSGKLKSTFVVIGIFLGEIYLFSLHNINVFPFEIAQIRNIAYFSLVAGFLISFIGIFSFIQYFGTTLRKKI